VVYAHDPPQLPQPPAHPLDPGQPLGQLDTRHPRLRRQPPDRAGADTHLRSYLNRIEAHFRPIQEFVFNNTDYLDWDAAAHALAAHVVHRNGPDRDRRVAVLERRHLIAA
jgi:hypothetical protein